MMRRLYCELTDRRQILISGDIGSKNKYLKKSISMSNETKRHINMEVKEKK